MHEPSWSGWKFWSKFDRIPLLLHFPPPPKMKISHRLWSTDLGTTFQEYPPPQIEIWADLGTLTFQLQNTPPKKLKFGQILALWLFSFRIPLPPIALFVADLGTFSFRIEIWADLALTFQFQNTPPPPLKIEIWADTLRLFSFRTMCGKLPHVETLSSPENYSLFPLKQTLIDRINSPGTEVIWYSPPANYTQKTAKGTANQPSSFHHFLVGCFLFWSFCQDM